MHLVSYLGYLIGKNNDSKCKYVIVSKDTDYDNIISFLHELSSSVITRQTKIDLAPQKTALQSSGTDKTINKAVKGNTTLSKRKVQLNTEIQKTVSSAGGYKESAINEVASIVVKHYGKENFALNVHNELRATYDDGLDIYQTIKPIIKKYSSAIRKK